MPRLFTVSSFTEPSFTERLAADARETGIQSVRRTTPNFASHNRLSPIFSRRR